MSRVVRRPELALHALLRDYPELSEYVLGFRAERGKNLPNWPGRVLLPHEAWRTIVSRKFGGRGRIPDDKYDDVFRLAAVGAWRYGRRIFRIAGEVRESLFATPIEKGIPMRIFRRLPDRCVYVETPGTEWRGRPLHGFWAHLAWFARKEEESLGIMLDSGRGLRSCELPLNVDAREALDRFARSIMPPLPKPDRANVADDLFKAEQAEARADGKLLERLLSLALYLCSELPEGDGSVAPSETREGPETKGDGRGAAPSPAKTTRIVLLGEKTAASLREAWEAAAAARRTWKSRRPPLPGGRWEGSGTEVGAGGDPRRFVLRWSPPSIGKDGGKEGETA